METPPAQAASNKLKSRLTVLLAALLWSSSGVFAKAPLFDDWPVEDRGLLLAFWRAAFAAAVLVPMIRRPKWSPWLVPMTIIFTVMCFVYMTAMAQTTAANAIWLQATYPWWVFLFSVFLLREPIVRRDLVPLVFGLSGVGLILFFEFTADVPNMLGVLSGLASGITYAAIVTLLRKLRDHSAAWLIGLNQLVAALVMLPLVLRIGITPTVPQLLVLAGFGIFQMGIPYVMIGRGLKTISSQEAAAICLIEPVLTPLWVLLVWGEVPATWTIAGASLILTGLILRYVVLPRVERKR